MTADEGRGSNARLERMRAMRARADQNERLRRDRGWKTWHWALDEPRSADNGGGPGVGPRKVWTGPATVGESDQRDLKRPVASGRAPKRKRK